MDNEKFQILLGATLDNVKEYDLSDLIHVSFDTEHKRILLHFKSGVEFIQLNKEGVNFCKVIKPYLMDRDKSEFINVINMV